MTFPYIYAFTAGLLVMNLNGCTSSPAFPPAGASVQNLIQLQTDHRLTMPPPRAGGARLDGQQAAAVMRVFRTAIAKPAEVNNEIHVNIGK